MDFNEEIGFKSLHYSVSESSKWVTIGIKNKTKKDITVGIRTIDDTALAKDDYIPIDETITVPAEQLYNQKIEVVDDDGWEPDEDFFVELYDVKTSKRLEGDNTRTKITILDDDKPGVL